VETEDEMADLLGLCEELGERSKVVCFVRRNRSGGTLWHLGGDTPRERSIYHYPLYTSVRGQAG